MNRKLVIAILAASLALRLAAGYVWQQRLPEGGRFAFPDSESYWVLAETIARGAPYQMGPDRQVFRTPGYPLLLAGLFVVAGEEPPVLWARSLNAVFGTLAVAGVMLLAGLLFDGRTAVWAGAAVGLYPEAIGASALVLTEAPFGPFMLLQLALWVWAGRAPRPATAGWLAAGGGLAAGAATLIRPSWLLFTPLALMAAFPARRPMWVGGVMLAGLGVVMTPWWIRNWQVTGTFVPTTLQVGESLYDGWNPAATGASDMRFVDDFRRELHAADACGLGAAAGGASFEQRLDRRMGAAAWSWAQAHPGRVAALAWNKFLRLWNVWPNEPSFRQGVVRFAVLLGYVPLLVAGLWGAYRFAARGWPWRLCLLPALYFTCLHVIFVGSIRYREPAMLPLIVLGAGCMRLWFGRDAARDGEKRRRGEEETGRS